MDPIPEGATTQEALAAQTAIRLEHLVTEVLALVAVQEVQIHPVAVAIADLLLFELSQEEETNFSQV